MTQFPACSGAFLGRACENPECRTGSSVLTVLVNLVHTFYAPVSDLGDTEMSETRSLLWEPMLEGQHWKGHDCGTILKHQRWGRLHRGRRVTVGRTVIAERYRSSSLKTPLASVESEGNGTRRQGA